MSLPFHNRLRHRRDFSLVYRKGLRCSSRHLILRALRCDRQTEQNSQVQADRENSHQLDSRPDQVGTCSQVLEHVPPRFGVSISQKVSKKAVVRNRIKRHLKAAFRHLLPRVKGGWLLVVVVRPSAVQCDYWQFLQELEQTLISAEVIDGHS